MFKRLLKYFSKKQAKTKAYGCNASRTQFVGSNCTLSLNCKNEEKVKKINEKLRVFLLKKANSTEKIIKYLKEKNVPFHQIQNAKKLLNLFNETEGVIFQSHGIKAFLFNILIGLSTGCFNISFSSPTMFVFEKGNIDFLEMSHQFHIYVQSQKNLPGFETNVQSQFKYLFKTSDKKILNNLTIDEMLSIKDAIKRDIEAINFTCQLAKEIDAKEKLKLAN